jgi:hypothetical protein
MWGYTTFTVSPSLADEYRMGILVVKVASLTYLVSMTIGIVWTIGFALRTGSFHPRRDFDESGGAD